jgi:hypothetical protein
MNAETFAVSKFSVKFDLSGKFQCYNSYFYDPKTKVIKNIVENKKRFANFTLYQSPSFPITDQRPPVQYQRIDA